MKSSQRKTITRCLLIATVLGSSLLPGISQGKMYKWIDENGHVQYGDRIPPQYAKQERKTLNEQGVTVDIKERAKTPEEIAEQRRQARLQAEEAERLRVQEEKDRILLDTFSNEDEMVMTRNGKVGAIDAIIRVTHGRIETLRTRLVELTAEAATLERSGKPVPERLHQEIQSSRLQIQDNEEYIRQKEQEQQDIRTKFETDIQRFRELMRLKEEQRRKLEAQNGG